MSGETPKPGVAPEPTAAVGQQLSDQQLQLQLLQRLLGNRRSNRPLDQPVLVVAADRSLRSTLARLEKAKASWLVVVRCGPGPEPVYYAYQVEEVRQQAKLFPDRMDLSLHEVLELHEWGASETARRGQPLAARPQGADGPASGRIVDLDADGTIVGIRARGAPFVPPTILQEGFADVWRRAIQLRGGSGGALPPSDPAAGHTGGGDLDKEWLGQLAVDAIEVMLSADVQSEIRVGTIEAVNFRIELAPDAEPLASSVPAMAQPDVPIVVALSVENGAIETQGASEITLPPPAPGEARTGYFLIKGSRAGLSRLAVAFRQGGTELGRIGLTAEVVGRSTVPGQDRGSAVAAPRDAGDDDKLTLLVEQHIEGPRVTYRYRLHSEAFNLQYVTYESKPLLSRDGREATSVTDFINRIYDRVTRGLRSFHDPNELQREARALGALLSSELFDPHVAKLLWPLRSRIKLIQVVSWEPYIPWELVRLRNPDTGEIDDRFLAEYSLVRTAHDASHALVLSLARWRYLAATFPNQTFDTVGAEVGYFTDQAQPSLRARAIVPDPVPATRDDLYDALATADFDVLHIACHAASEHDAIERASLIISDETRPGAAAPSTIKVDATTVRAEVGRHLFQRHPLVFLNGCETGRSSPVLTAWGGWPDVFLRAGAGAFVGTAWGVRDRPAAVFSTAFYEALLDNKTLAEAAGTARAAAKQLGDVSWLAYRVYGHPRARRAVSAGA
jgi:hypothetical protein